MSLIFRQTSAPYIGTNVPLTFVEGDNNLRWLESSSVASMSFDGATNTLTLFRASSPSAGTSWPALSTPLFGLTATASVIISSTAPVGTPTGSLWYDDISGSLFINYNDGVSTYWVQANNGWSASYSDTSSYAATASVAVTSSYSFIAATASYIDVTGSGVLVNWNGPTLQLTASGASIDTLQDVTTRGGITSASVDIQNTDGTTQVTSSFSNGFVNIVSTGNNIDGFLTFNKTGNGSLEYKATDGTLGANSDMDFTPGTASFAITGPTGTGTVTFTSTTASLGVGLVQVQDMLLLQNYAALNYANDTAAAAGGVPLGGVYRSGNVLMIRTV